jgi:hypothetical protein
MCCSLKKYYKLYQLKSNAEGGACGRLAEKKNSCTTSGRAPLGLGEKNGKRNIVIRLKKRYGLDLSGSGCVLCQDLVNAITNLPVINDTDNTPLHRNSYTRVIFVSDDIFFHCFDPTVQRFPS